MTTEAHPPETLHQAESYSETSKLHWLGRNMLIAAIFGGAGMLLTEWSGNAGLVGELAEDLLRFAIWCGLFVPVLLLARREVEAPRFRRTVYAAFAMLIVLWMAEAADEIEALRYVPFLGAEGYLHSTIENVMMFAMAGTVLLAFFRLAEKISMARDRLEIQVQERTAALSSANAQLRDENETRKRVEATLRASEERFRRAVAGAPFPIMIHAEDGEVLEINEVWSDITGYTHEEIPTIGSWIEKAYGERSELVRARIDKLFDLDSRLGEGEFEITTASGQTRIWDFDSGPLGRTADGRRLVISSANDVTDRRQSEEEVRQSEKKYRDLIEATGIGYTILDASGSVLDANAEFVRLTGHTTLEEIRGRSVVEWTAEHDRERNAAEVEQCMRNRVTKDLEIDYVAPDGTMTPVEIHGTAVDTPDGPIILGLCRDITARKQVDAELRRSRTDLEERVQQRTVELSDANRGLNQEIEERKRVEFDLREANQRFQDLATNAPGVLFQLRTHPPDTAIEIPYVSSGVKSLLGVDAAAIMADSRRGLDLVQFEDSTDFRRQLREVALSGTPFKTELRCVALNGDVKWVNVSAVAHRQSNGDLLYNGIAIDVTERRAIEQARDESEERYRTLVEHAPEAIVLIDVDRARFVDTNTNAVKLFKRDKELLLDLSPVDVSASTQAGKAALDLAREYTARSLKGETPVFEWTFVDSRGTQIPCEVRLVRFPSAARRLVRASITDISERKRAEAALSHSEQRFRDLVEGSIQGILIHRNHKPLFVNHAYASIYGYSMEEMLEMDSVSPITAPRDRTRMQHYEDARMRGEDVPTQYECYGLRKDGSEICLEQSARLIEWDDQPAVQITTVEITERKRAEEQLRQNEETFRQQREELAHVARLSTMGEMASGLAHELNQPLSAIVTYSESGLIGLRSGSLSPDRWHEVLQKINNQAIRAGEIINRLKVLVAKRAPHRSLIDINELVQEVAALVEWELRMKQVRLNLDLEQPLQSVPVDAIQIQQVLVNLITNGIDAMAGLPADRRLLMVRTSKLDNRGIEVRVIDSGPGVLSEHGKRIFEPFFTTKTGGMGMGLSISRSIVESHGGKLSLKPNGNRGTAFYFDLPFECGSPTMTPASQEASL